MTEAPEESGPKLHWNDLGPVLDEAKKQPYDVPAQSDVHKARTYGFADGHMEIHHSPEGDFEAWERERMIAPAR